MEKGPLESKKYRATVLAEMSWTLLLGLAIWRADSIWWGAVLIALVLVKGMGLVVYTASQAALDKYVRVAEIAARRDDASPNH